MFGFSGTNVTSGAAAAGAAASTAETVEQATRDKLTRVARERNYHLIRVSWQDAQRTSINGQITSSGSNICDVTMFQKSGVPIYCLRSENLDERVGLVSLDELAMVVGNHDYSSERKSVTLRDALKRISVYGQHVCASDTRPLVLDKELDASVRFQAVFLPLSADTSGKQTTSTEFATQTYSYQTKSDGDPRNLLILATPQGSSFQFDGVGRQVVLHHELGTDGKIHRYWTDIEASHAKVGGAQLAINHIQDEKQKQVEIDASQRGKSTAVRIGTPSMGTRFNAHMLIQVPLQQRTVYAEQSGFGLFGFGDGFGPYGGGGGFGSVSSSGGFSFGSVSGGGSGYTSGFGGGTIGGINFGYVGGFGSSSGSGGGGFGSNESTDGFAFAFGSGSCCTDQHAARVNHPVIAEGMSNAARVSRGSEYDVYTPNKKTAVRESDSRITVTITFFYVVQNGVPSTDDIRRAMDDMDEQYRACKRSGTLSTLPNVTQDHSMPEYKVPPFAPIVDTGFPLSGNRVCDYVHQHDKQANRVMSEYVFRGDIKCDMCARRILDGYNHAGLGKDVCEPCLIKIGEICPSAKAAFVKEFVQFRRVL